MMSDILRIMPVGDSITAGSDENRGGYRGHLQDLLDEFGVAHQYVGSRKDRSTGVRDAAHEGYPGWSMTQLLKGDSTDWGSLTSLADSVKTYEPNVMLLLCGTNPIYLGEPEPVMQTMRDLVDDILAVQPAIHLFLGSILPILPGPKPWNMTVPESILRRVKQYNILQAGFVADRRKAGKHLYFVDHYPIVRGQDDLGADGVHPGPGVFPRMAWTWFAAMKAAGLF
ncbi:MAG: GDSL-type esterase/lipase family protein [Phycisphaerales bacterium]